MSNILFCPNIKMCKQGGSISWNINVDFQVIKLIFTLSILSEQLINWTISWTKQQWRHNNVARTNLSLAVTFSLRLILRRYQSVWSHWIFPRLLLGQPALSVCPWVNIRVKERETQKDIQSSVSQGSPEMEGADVEEEPFHSRPVSGGVFGH